MFIGECKSSCEVISREAKEIWTEEGRNLGISKMVAAETPVGGGWTHRSTGAAARRSSSRRKRRGIPQLGSSCPVRSTLSSGLKVLSFAAKHRICLHTHMQRCKHTERGREGGGERETGDHWEKFTQIRRIWEVQKTFLNPQDVSRSLS